MDEKCDPEIHGSPPVDGQSFPHSDFYNSLLAGDPGNDLDRLSSWTSYRNSLPNDLSLGLNLGYNNWPSYQPNSQFENFAADTFATSGHLPLDSAFQQNIEFLSRARAASEQNPAFFASNPLESFNQAASDGKNLYEEALSQLPEPSASLQQTFSGRTYDPFTSNVFTPAAVDSVVADNQDTGGIVNNPVPQPSQPSKPSYSEVAKHKLANNTTTSKKESHKVTSHERASPVNLPPPIKPHKSKKVKAAAHTSRSQSVPVVSTTIRPDSRYGLDTFDIDDTMLPTQTNSSAETKEKGDSMDSDASDVTNVYNIDGPGPGVGVKYHSELGDIMQEPQTKTESKPSTKNTDKKQKNSNSKSGKAFFDPKRIFSEKEKKSQSSFNTFIPNNQQNINNEEADYNSGKGKNNWKTSSAKYINNDLRDSKKQTNTETRNFGSFFDEDALFKSEFSSSGKGKRSEHNNVKKSTSTMTDEPGLKSPTKKNKKDKTDVQHLINIWLIHLYDWTIWGGKELIQLVYKLAKLLITVSILFMLVCWHYLSSSASKCWQYLVSKMPFLGKYTSHTHDEDTTSQQPKIRMFGLKENISLPSTGEEAMKRLLSCKGKDPYSILGLRADASDDDIKRYYRRQAVLVHPDKNKQPGAEEAFKILGHAIELIGEPEKRKQYDSQRTEAEVVETAMQEFADLLSKLHEKMEEAANMMRCDHCGGKHKRVPVQFPAYSARFCSRCNVRHQAKEGDVWAESSVLGFYWHYYACMEGKVYDITEWASCQHESFKCLQANSHNVIYRISTGAGRHRNNSSRASEAELEDFLSNLFHQSTPADNFPPQGSNAPKANNWNQGGTKKGRHRKKKKVPTATLR